MISSALDRLGVDLLHPAGGLGARRSPATSSSSVGRVVVPGPEALEVEHAEAAVAGRARSRSPGDITESIGAARTGSSKR